MSTGWAATDDEYIVGCLAADFFRFPGCCPGIQLGQNLFNGHPAGAEFFTVEVHGGHGHDLPCRHFILE